MNAMEASDLIYMIGNHKGFKNSFYEGVITNFWTYEDVEYCETTVPMDGSYSGAALIDAYGRLIGIVSNKIPKQDSFIQSTTQLSIFDMYFENSGKNAAVKIPFSQGGEERYSADLIKLSGYYTLYTGENLPSELKVDANKSIAIYEAVKRSLKDRSDYMSGAIGDEKGGETAYFSSEIDETELKEQRLLRDTLIKGNEGESELTSYMVYDELTVMALSQGSDTPYVLIEVKTSFYDKEKDLEAPIKIINSLELLKYNAESDQYQLVGTVN